MIDKSEEIVFWKQINERHPELSSANGCYIFGIKAKFYTPWYVGKAERQSFEKETLTGDKLNKFNYILHERRGYPFLFFIARLDACGNFYKPRKSKESDGKIVANLPRKLRLNDIDKLETLFIREAYRVNKDLSNLQKLYLEKNITIDGYLNSTKGRRNESEIDFTKMMSFNKESK